MANNMHHISRQKAYGDVQRSFLWDVEILLTEQNFLKQKPAWSGASGITGLARETAFKGRTGSKIESSYKGMKRNLPAKAEYDGELQITFEETSTQAVLALINEMELAIHNNVSTGVAHVDLPSGNETEALSFEIVVYPLHFNGTRAPYGVKYIGAWLQNRDEVSASYESADANKIPCTFSYDYHSVCDAQGNEVEVYSAVSDLSYATLSALRIKK